MHSILSSKETLFVFTALYLTLEMPSNGDRSNS